MSKVRQVRMSWEEESELSRVGGKAVMVKALEDRERTGFQKVDGGVWMTTEVERIS